MTLVNSGRLQFWLYTLAAMVFIMAVIGAITRLTESGLSITEWNVVTGTLPPLSDDTWMSEFEKYKATPEYIKKNAGMSLSEFKTIYFWEWIHRVWGRLIGLAALLPLLFFAVTKQIPKGYGLKLSAVFILVCLQGAMGWFMVKSGLIDRPSVSHYRLAAHLGLAFLIFGYVIWLSRELGNSATKTVSFCIRRHGWIAFAVLCITIIWGAFVAGLDAGLIYNTYPLMDGKFFPAGTPDIFNEHGWVQFTHRWLAIATAVLILSYAWRLKNWAIAGLVTLQVGLGIATLLSQVWLPLGVLHQASAFALFGAMVWSLACKRAS